MSPTESTDADLIAETGTEIGEESPHSTEVRR